MKTSAKPAAKKVTLSAEIRRHRKITGGHYQFFIFRADRAKHACVGNLYHDFKTLEACLRYVMETFAIPAERISYEGNF